MATCWRMTRRGFWLAGSRTHASPTSACHTTGCALAAVARLCCHRRESTSAQSFKCASAAAVQLCSQSGCQALCASASHSRRDALTDSACICYCRSGTLLCELLSARVTHTWSGMYVRSREDVSSKLCAVLRCLSVVCRCTSSSLSDGIDRRGFLVVGHPVMRSHIGPDGVMLLCR